jgi:hypothetical protein
MTDHPEPTNPVLQSLLEENADTVRKAFSEGYRLGYEAAYTRMRKSLAGGLEQAGVKPQGSAPPAPKAPLAPLRIAPSNIEPNAYGAVINTIRHALGVTSETGLGISARQLVQYCRDQGINTTLNSVRDCLKRLKASEEVENAHGTYYGTPQLRRLEAQAEKETAASPELALTNIPASEVEH